MQFAIRVLKIGNSNYLVGRSVPKNRNDERPTNMDYSSAISSIMKLPSTSSSLREGALQQTRPDGPFLKWVEVFRNRQPRRRVDRNGHETTKD